VIVAILKVARIGHPVVRTRAEPVPEKAFGSAEMKQLIADMRDTLREYDGVGLAAPQVHLGLRLAVIEVEATDERTEDAVPFMVLANPTLVPLSEEKEDGWEGCLSIPDLRGIVPRHTRLRLEARDEKGKPYSLEASGFFARVIQHECDHLDGGVYLDRMAGMDSLSFLQEFERFRAGEDEEA
jgi:peptide deformylase